MADDEEPREGPRSTERAGDAGNVRHLLRQLEDVLRRSEQQVVGEVGARVVPAWLRATEGEPRWQIGRAHV